MLPAVHVSETPLDRVTPLQPGTRNQGPVVTFDLGTSNVRIAALQNGRPTVLAAPRQRTPPSWVAVGPRGSVVTGAAAEQQAASRADLAVFGVKRLTEGAFQSPEIRALRSRQSCPFFEGPGGQTGVRLGDRNFSPRELIAILLADARFRAMELLGQPVYRAAIATPVGRGGSHTQFMAAAAAMAGMHLVGAVPEPIAAATLGTPKRGKTLGVFDWGGGAFRFTVLRFAGPAPEVLASVVDPLLGGIELDPLILGYLLGGLEADHPLRLDESTPRNPRLLAAAERLKIDLSTKDSARAHVPFVLGFGADATDFSATLSRAELAPILEPFIRRAFAFCEDELGKVGLFPGDLAEVILCGEQTRSPAVQQRCEQFFSGAPLRRENPGDLVVLGACAAIAASQR